MSHSPDAISVRITDDINRPIVVLCGSTEFMDEFNEANIEQTAMGRIVLTVGCNMKKPHPLWDTVSKAEALKVKLDELHKDKIRMADYVLVVGTRIEDSTQAQIEFALSLGKMVAFYHPELEMELQNIRGLNRLIVALRKDAQ
jgi:hypothetical protein